MKMKSFLIMAVIFFFGLSNCSSLRSRKKRQIMDAINALTEEVLEAEKMEKGLKGEKVQSKKEEVQSVRCAAAVNSQCGGKECIVSCSDGQGEKVALTCESGFVDVKASSGDAAIVEVRCGTEAAKVDQGKAPEKQGVVSRKRRQAKKEEVQSVEGPNMLRCGAAVNSQCGGKECVVSCSDGQGEKVVLTCDSGLVDVKASSGDAAIVEVRCGTAAKEVDQGKALETEEVVSRKKRQSHNPLFGREGFKNVHNTPGLFGNVQQCQGGKCDQLNLLSRRKRQIVEAMETLTEEVDKFEKEVEQLEKDLKNEQQVHMLSCDSNVNSRCKGKECVVSCGDGKGSKITLQCEDGLIFVNSVNSRDVADVQVRCGSAKEAAGKAKAFRDLLQSQSPILKV